mgnify:CR=1 FL=1
MRRRGCVRQPFSPEAESYWGPVDLYIGGASHAVLHLLYARFWHKVFFDIGLVSQSEPFQKLFNQGILTAPAYQDETGRLSARLITNIASPNMIQNTAGLIFVFIISLRKYFFIFDLLLCLDEISVAAGVILGPED